MKALIQRTTEYCLGLAMACWGMTIQAGLVVAFPVPIYTEQLRCPMEGVRYLEAAYLHVPPLDFEFPGGSP